jgi:AcrR family transcriptional regulator
LILKRRWTSTAQLAEAMGLNPPRLYVAFGSKVRLFRAALDRYTIRRGASLDQGLNAPTARIVAEKMLMATVDVRPLRQTRRVALSFKAACPQLDRIG